MGRGGRHAFSSQQSLERSPGLGPGRTGDAPAWIRTRRVWKSERRALEGTRWSCLLVSSQEELERWALKEMSPTAPSLQEASPVGTEPPRRGGQRRNRLCTGVLLCGTCSMYVNGIGKVHGFTCCNKKSRAGHWRGTWASKAAPCLVIVN